LWQSQIEIEDYSTSVKNELTVLIKSLRACPTSCASANAIRC